MDERLEALKQALLDAGWEKVRIDPWHEHETGGLPWGPHIGYRFWAWRYCDRRCETFAAAVNLKKTLLQNTDLAVITELLLDGFQSGWDQRMIVKEEA